MTKDILPHKQEAKNKYFLQPKQKMGSKRKESLQKRRKGSEYDHEECLGPEVGMERNQSRV